MHVLLLYQARNAITASTLRGTLSGNPLGYPTMEKCLLFQISKKIFLNYITNIVNLFILVNWFAGNWGWGR